MLFLVTLPCILFVAFFPPHAQHLSKALSLMISWNGGAVVASDQKSETLFQILKPQVNTILLLHSVAVNSSSWQFSRPKLA